MALPHARANQKTRTRRAILEACRQLIRAGGELTMPAVAQAALVSEATAYRYFPDLLSLLGEAMRELLPEPAELLAPAAHSTDPVERVACAAQALAEHVLAYQSAVRAMISATITRPTTVSRRPGIRFGLIDAALELASADPAVLARLKVELAVVLSPEALFVLTDSYRLPPSEAVARTAQLATTVTRAALERSPN